MGDSKMGVAHQFAIISKESKEFIITSDMESVLVPDLVIQYIRDSLDWIVSYWNGKDLRKNLSYYGFSIIESDEIAKLIKILEGWKNLFHVASDEFCITGAYLPEEERYEKILLRREDMEKWLNDFIIICQKAMNDDHKILHNGI